MRKSVIFYFLISVSVVVYTFTVAFWKLKEEYSPIERAESYKGILTLWHVDSFEGGKGSRKEFLNNAAIKFGKQSSAMILVSEYTVEGITENFKEGKYPDMISFGPSVASKAEIKKMPFEKSYEGEAEGNNVYAKVWCRGSYFLITKLGVTDGVTVISKGSYNLSEVAAASIGVNLAESEVLAPLKAYSEFCSAKGFRLIGTQRDIRRLISKNIEFEAVPVSGFNDLYQYISITTSDAEKLKICSAYIKYLLSAEVQKAVDKIGMLPATELSVYADGALKAAEKVRAEYTVSPFITRGELNLISAETLKSAKEGGEIPIEIKKFLK